MFFSWVFISGDAQSVGTSFFLITVYFCSLLLQQAMENSMGARDEREGNEQGAK